MHDRSTDRRVWMKICPHGKFPGRIDRHIELDGDSHGPMGRELMSDLIANSPNRGERALQAACSSIEARIRLWDGTLSKLRNGYSEERSGETYAA